MRPVRSSKFALLGIVAAAVFTVGVASASLPNRLTDHEFWRLSTELSEPEGAFRFDNLVSNERGVQYVVQDLMRAHKTGGVYLGVGPEQNFTYIAAVCSWISH